MADTQAKNPSSSSSMKAGVPSSEPVAPLTAAPTKKMAPVAAEDASKKPSLKRPAVASGPNKEDQKEKASVDNKTSGPTQLQRKRLKSAPAVAEQDTASSPAASSTASSAQEDDVQPLDLAVTLGFKAGDRIEVQWEIETKDGESNVHWWGATLLPHDGRTTDSVAIRTIHYDAYPELGFHECDGDVIFLGEDMLVEPPPDEKGPVDVGQTQMRFRREGNEDEVFWLNPEDLDAQLNAILMGALDKNKNAWQSLTPAQQALIAEKISQKKEKLLQVLQGQKEVITSSTIKNLLQTAFES